MSRRRPARAEDDTRPEGQRDDSPPPSKRARLCVSVEADFSGGRVAGQGNGDKEPDADVDRTACADAQHLLSLPPEILAMIKDRLDPLSSLWFRSSSTLLRALTTASDRRWDTETGPIDRCVTRVLPLVGIDAARLVDVDRPTTSKKRWPPVHTTGRQAPIDQPTLKRYALNAALLRYLAHRGVANVTDAFGHAWDESVRGEAADKKRWNVLRLPAPRDTRHSPNAVCTLTFAFDMQGGDYKRSLFAQTKGANVAGIDTCFEHATAVYAHALGRAFGTRAVPFLLAPQLYGGPAPRIAAAGARCKGVRFG
ncbi:hypothetical protein psal_cds_40 [Pandoravirus salinus]|uniref:F-box domain containing protein n=1 Tax=Pandoravirus salinus TaxID=1349410 RepID=S4VVI1_9VIRU|nr:hypothetical protein psal_cds_40 [Pandoravirus salinus]AGO83421.1 hypothetical protein psal_cds_40 [Pandoravirus salinus]